ncbi:acetylxylan esterase [Paraglaciecola sp. 2405UD69-4]|uniref:acetylxylan esterase n=1 Tax=Paraglaciecola sp. 2405UD69-4 TaxID=3391836 RepID=UPI0039C8C5D6
MNPILDNDPYGAYSLENLLSITASNRPNDFNAFWQKAYNEVITLEPKFDLHDTGHSHKNWKLYDVSFQSTDSITIWGWLLVPIKKTVNRVFVAGHGYAGRQGPDFDLPFDDAAIYFPCSRGISRSAAAPISQEPYWHVRHDIDKKERYIIRGCVEDVWLSVSVVKQLYPDITGGIYLLGVSFSGGVGMLALAQDTRITKAHFNVPTFGHHQLRLRIPTHGSGKSIQDFYHSEPFKLIRTLRYYDAAYAASNVTVPVHFALALRDPVVTPPGQFAIYNEVKSEKHLYVLEAGHDSYPSQAKQAKELIDELLVFFS